MLKIEFKVVSSLFDYILTWLIIFGRYFVQLLPMKDKKILT